MGTRTSFGRLLRFAAILFCAWGCSSASSSADPDPEKNGKAVSVGNLDEKIKKYVSAKPPKDIGTKRQVRFGDNFILLGYDVSKTKFHPGDTIEVTWYWQCLRPVTPGWQLFTHGIHGDGNIALNTDNKGIETFASVRKKFPPSEWRPGTYIRDVQKLRIPEDFKPEQIELRVGFWLGNDRVPVKKGLADGDNRAKGPSLQKRPPKKIEVSLKRLPEPPKIDGEIAEEKAWREALKLDEFKEIIKGKRSKAKTQMYLGYTDEHLYLAFIAEDNDLKIPPSAVNDELWKGDSFSVLLDPAGDGKNYYELQFNPAGARYDARLEEYRKADPSFESGAEIVVKYDGTLNDDEGPDKGWRAELRIPVGAFGEEAPKAGDVWHVNFYRTDVERDDIEYSAWSPPLRGDLHYFKKFGKLSIGR